MALCENCGQDYKLGQWPWCNGNGEHSRPHGRQGGAVHTSERAVVYRNPATGQVNYPARNDQPMPKKLERWGYERVELPSLRDVERLEKQDNVRSDVAWFDRGTGNADKLPDVKPIDLTGLEFTNSGG